LGAGGNLFTRRSYTSHGRTGLERPIGQPGSVARPVESETIMNKANTYALSLIWAAALIATAIVLKGTPQSKLVIDILSTCVAATTLILGLACRGAGGSRSIPTKA